LWKPEAVDLPVLADEVGWFYPEREVPRGMAFDPDQAIVLNIDPYFALETEILTRWEFISVTMSSTAANGGARPRTSQ
jgi:hypothetical protein